MDRTAVGADNSWRNWDWYVQGNYNYLGRYFVQANVTASASSRVGDEAKKGGIVFGKALWGLFPSLQAAWVITNEPFSFVFFLITINANCASKVIRNAERLISFSLSHYMTFCFISVRTCI